jgi:ureidoglycolate dehydrogenase (NAD+)
MSIDYKKLERFICDILVAEGVADEEAQTISRVLVWCDAIGRSTHGVIRIPVYLKRFKLGLIKSPCQPKIIQKTATIATIDGNDGFGHYLGSMAMTKAIELAEKSGIGMVGVSHSNHFGANAYYVQMAAAKSQIGLAFTNGFPRTAPHGGTTAVLGTNPIGFSAPMRNGESVLVDFSTSSVSGAAIRQAIVEDRQIPDGVLLGENLQAQGADEDAILPFGGAKGFCLGLMVEILSGAISHQVGSIYKNFDRPSDVGHLFMSIDIAKVIDLESYYHKMDLLIAYIKSARKQLGVEEILIPGETRWRNYQRQLQEGIELAPSTISSLVSIAQDLQISIPW